MSGPEKEKTPYNFDLHVMQLQAQQQNVSHQNVVDHPQPAQQQQQFPDMPINITSSIGDLERCNQNQNSRNEALSSLGDQDPNHHQQRRSSFRHSHEQIQEMEAFFQQCPRPNGKQRNQLSCVLGLTPTQIKFWFQNKRNQNKTQQELHQNYLLRDENEKIRAENNIYKEALKDTLCTNCAGPISIGEVSFNNNQLRTENARLKVEIEMFAGKLINDVDLVGSSSKIGQMSTPAFEMGSGSDISSSMIEELLHYNGNDPLGSLSIPNDFDKATIVELAVVSMKELTMLTLAGSPLWISTNDTEILNEVEYLRVFPKSPKLTGLKSESSRESVIVTMNHINLIDMLMDVSQWSTMFHGIVSNALTLEVLSPGVSGNYNGALQVMSADFQVPSPLVPARENYFVRYCKKHQEGIWAVVDVSLDHLRPSSSTMARRRPSGCLIQELPNGCSKVTWVEHVEVDENTTVSNPLCKSLITYGLAFGAKRWVTSLDRQCERFACSMTNNIPVEDHCGVNSLQGKRNLLQLVERMKICFYAAVGSSVAGWEMLTYDCNDVRVMTKTSIDEPGTPTGIVLSVGTSIWLPVLPRRLFDFLRSQNSRSEWDVFSAGGIIKEMEHITHGRDLGNYVSLFHISSANSSQNNMVILQDNSIDNTCSHVIYAPVDIGSMNAILNGGDPNSAVLLPSGFVILPNRAQLNKTTGPMLNTIEHGGCLLTISFQFLVDPSPTKRIENNSMVFAVKLIKNTAERIKVALVDSNA